MTPENPPPSAYAEPPHRRVARLVQDLHDAIHQAADRLDAQNRHDDARKLYEAEHYARKARQIVANVYQTSDITSEEEPSPGTPPGTGTV